MLGYRDIDPRCGVDVSFVVGNAPPGWEWPRVARDHPTARHPRRLDAQAAHVEQGGRGATKHPSPARAIGAVGIA
eukprot:4239-Alexandrium_andersonii.AAC.1